MSASVRIDQSRLQRLLSAVGGPGNRLLIRKAERVADLARAYAAGHGSIPEGITVGPVEGKSIKVISTNPHTIFVHNGTPRHPIRPRRPGGYLRFQVDGRTVYARAVNHPGYRGDPFLTKALRDAG
ncbi:hypothetical protein [Streptomyces phage phiSAJS1]|uniref:hypothetical protein n=1 Tax=Streptomyces phage phiSAJS1 TaxID=1755682 RepID=UPI000E30115E|nr:hypothetical protein AVT91_p14 [Streptomyces phage phiSAJS1]AXP07816.1 hypothetical protein [Streptomyces phage phiSAJS1]